MKHRLINIFYFVLSVGIAKAQDSLKKISGEQVAEIVMRFHPVARQAHLQIEKAKADLTISRAGFDPTLEKHQCP